MLDPTPELPDDTPISEVEFPARIRNVLAAAGLKKSARCARRCSATRMAQNAISHNGNGRPNAAAVDLGVTRLAPSAQPGIRGDYFLVCRTTSCESGARCCRLVRKVAAAF